MSNWVYIGGDGIDVYQCTKCGAFGLDETCPCSCTKITVDKLIFDIIKKEVQNDEEEGFE